LQKNYASPHLLEPWKLVEQHRQHHLVGLFGQVGQEEDLVWRGVHHVATGGAGGGAVLTLSRRLFLG